MKKKELLAILKALVLALAEQETPRPKPAPAPMPAAHPIMRTFLNSNNVEVWDGANWVAAEIIPHGYQHDPDDGGYWKAWHQ